MTQESPYLTFFNLKEEPFSASPNPRFFYTSPLHHLALQKTSYIVSAKKGLSLVLGDTGTGKTTLARLLYQTFVDKGLITALLTNPAFPTPNQLLRTIMQEFEYPNFGRSYKVTLDRFKEFLIEQAINEQKTIVLIVDEAQTLTPTLLEFLRQLLNFETNEQKLLQLVLFAQNELRPRLQRARNVNNRIAMRANLETLTLNDSQEMLRFRWTVAGGKQFPFTPEAIQVIYDYTGGVPRSQVVLADNMLLAAFIAEQPNIDKELALSVAEDQEFQPTS